MTVRYWWDNCLGNPGWYAEVMVGRKVVGDSMKVWFPVDVDSFGKGDSAKLEAALRVAYPQAEIIYVD